MTSQESKSVPVEVLRDMIRKLLGDLSDAERAVAALKFKGGMGANIAQEDRGRFPTISSNAHRFDAEALLSSPSAEAATNPHDEMWEAANESATGRLQVADVVVAVDRWCDERRNAPTMTTLGMVQEYVRLFVKRGPAPTQEKG